MCKKVLVYVEPRSRSLATLYIGSFDPHKSQPISYTTDRNKAYVFEDISEGDSVDELVFDMNTLVRQDLTIQNPETGYVYSPRLIQIEADKID